MNENNKSVYNKEFVDYKEQPMFFGEELNVSRFDSPPRPIFDKMTKRMMQLFWQPEEIDLTKDVGDYKLLSEGEKHMWKSNLMYQTLLDSVQGRAPVLAFLPHVTDPSLETAVIWWDAFETIHSMSYSYVLRNVEPNPTETFDSIMNDGSIQDRALSVTKYYDDFYNDGIFMLAHPNIKEDEEWMREIKKKLYMSLVSANALEGVRFYVSFACNFAMAELKKMEGSAKIISLIMRDESVHLSLVQNILKEFKKDDEMLSIMEECEDLVYEVYDEVVEQEKEWAEHLFSKGTVLGLNAEILSTYVEHIANKRLRAIGLDEKRYGTAWNKNPLPWMDNWTESDRVQVAPQETEISSYLASSSLDNNISENAFGDIEL